MPLPDDLSSLPVLRAAKESVWAVVRGIPGVVGVGVGVPGVFGGIPVYVEQDTQILRTLIPAFVPGSTIPVRVVQVGRLQAQARGQRYRPLVAGASIGHVSITAGTLGGFVRDSSTGRALILSNNHVLAAVDAGNGVAHAGDPITQPGSLDGGSEAVARLLRWVPLKPSGSGFNYVDAALAEPLVDVDPRTIDVGPFWEGARAPVAGEHVIKSGRTTGLTSGQIIDLDARVTRVSYGSIECDFDHQLMTTGMSMGGDSGSLLLSRDGRHVIGLLFAGSQEATLFNYPSAVAAALGIMFPNWRAEASSGTPAPPRPIGQPIPTQPDTNLGTETDEVAPVESSKLPVAMAAIGAAAIIAAIAIME